jgi:ribosomal protein S27E
MQTVSCPGCGAPVEFKSHASVMAVCEFCRTVVVKDGESVADLGKLSQVLEDYSRIQVGTTGLFAARPFTVVGRIQLRYSAGMWNEWHLLFDDGTTGWLGDSSGLYVITTERPLGDAWPAFEQIEPGRDYDFGGGRFTAAEKRIAQCIGGQGELPFRVGQGWQARVADLRVGAGFVTLDYSDGDKPVLYSGNAVTLGQLQCQLLRDDEQIRASAGKFRGKVQPLECPECGTAISYLPGVTSSIVCQSCHTQLDAASPQVLVLAKGAQMERVHFTLPVGAKANINGTDHQVLGAMRRSDDDGAGWNEYLLYSTSDQFFWLVETDDGWSRAKVMDAWPESGHFDDPSVVVDKVPFRRMYAYTARVDYVAGAFNWRVAVGDTVQVVEYERGTSRLAAERTPEELTWSRSTPVAFDQVRAWFQADVAALRRLPAAPRPAKQGQAVTFMWWVLGLNAIPLMLNFSGTILWVVLGLIALFVPPRFVKGED